MITKRNRNEVSVDFSIEMRIVLDRMQKEQRFWDSLHAAGFKRGNQIFDCHFIKHEYLPITCSFKMIPNTLSISCFTDPYTGNWTYPASACYELNGEWFVDHKKLTEIVTPENFITMLITVAREMATDILKKLDNRTL